MQLIPVDNFGTVVGENPTPYGSLALVGCQWTVNCLLGCYQMGCKTDISIFHFLAACVQWVSIITTNVTLQTSFISCIIDYRPKQ